MKIKKEQKLKLHRETLRHLGTAEVSLIAGGTLSETTDCGCPLESQYGSCTCTYFQTKPV